MFFKQKLAFISFLQENYYTYSNGFLITSTCRKILVYNT